MNALLSCQNWTSLLTVYKVVLQAASGLKITQDGYLLTVLSWGKNMWISEVLALPACHLLCPIHPCDRAMPFP